MAAAATTFLLCSNVSNSSALARSYQFPAKIQRSSLPVIQNAAISLKAYASVNAELASGKSCKLIVVRDSSSSCNLELRRNYLSGGWFFTFLFVTNCQGIIIHNCNFHNAARNESLDSCKRRGLLFVATLPFVLPLFESSDGFGAEAAE